MKNNKGFSLVELIIVIAIMAILVGVMAPQLIKYIEKTNVSSDTQLADSVRSAITTAMLDPAVIQADDYTFPSTGEFETCVSDAGDTFKAAVYEILGIDDASDLKLKSKDASGVKVYILNSNSVAVEIEGSHADGNGGEETIVVPEGASIGE